MAAPNAYQTGPDFMFAFVQSYLFQGNTYCFARRNRRNEIQEMHVLNPYRVKPLIAQDGSIFYECGEDFLAGLAPNTIVPERDMIHHRLPLLPGYPLVGVTPIFAAAASSAVGLKILQNSQQFFSNASRPSGMLTSESGRISPGGRGALQAGVGRSLSQARAWARSPSCTRASSSSRSPSPRRTLSSSSSSAGRSRTSPASSGCRRSCWAT